MSHILCIKLSFFLYYNLVLKYIIKAMSWRVGSWLAVTLCKTKVLSGQACWQWVWWVGCSIGGYVGTLFFASHILWSKHLPLSHASMVLPYHRLYHNGVSHLWMKIYKPVSQWTSPTSIILSCILQVSSLSDRRWTLLHLLHTFSVTKTHSRIVLLTYLSPTPLLCHLHKMSTSFDKSLLKTWMLPTTASSIVSESL